MAEERLQIAVFIDFDNISIGVKNSLSRNFEIGAVLEAIKERGEVITKIAYGDWKRAEDFSRAMTQYAVQMVQRNVTPRGDKNGADINLALDALEMAFTRNHINAFVIVGGDSDFIALVEKLKQYGKKVFVVGGRAFTSIILQKNCHEFIAYENLVGAQSSAVRKIAGKMSSMTGTAPLENALPQVRRALKVLSDREVSPQLGLLKSTLLQLDPTFSERDFGASTFLEFIQKMANAGFVNLKQVDRSWLVELKEQDIASVQRILPLAVPAMQRAAGGFRAGSESPAQPGPQGPPQATPGGSEASAAMAEPRPEPPPPSADSARTGEAIAMLRRIFTDGKSNLHWPMYLRSFKQLLRSTEPGFDERSFGFTSVYDLVRQTQREGLLRIERNRKGILRIFPGDQFPQATQPGEPVEAAAVPVEESELPMESEPGREPVQEYVPEFAPEPPAEAPVETTTEAPLMVEREQAEGAHEQLEQPRRLKPARGRKGTSARQPKPKRTSAPKKARPKKTPQTT